MVSTREAILRICPTLDIFARPTNHEDLLQRVDMIWTTRNDSTIKSCFGPNSTAFNLLTISYHQVLADITQPNIFYNNLLQLLGDTVCGISLADLRIAKNLLFCLTSDEVRYVLPLFQHSYE
jgi:hypothetical protein